jgi:hypothetical protein
MGKLVNLLRNIPRHMAVYQHSSLRENRPNIAAFNTNLAANKAV